MPDIDPRIAYMNARKACLEQAAGVSRLQKLLRTVAGEIGNAPHRFHFTGSDVRREASGPAFGPVADASDWPSAETIMQTLAAFDEIDREQMRLWTALDRDDRQGLQSPVTWPREIARR